MAQKQLLECAIAYTRMTGILTVPHSFRAQIKVHYRLMH
jgi:hypothetical protein